MELEIGILLSNLSQYYDRRRIKISYLFHEGACGNVQDAHKYIAHTNFYIHQLKMLKDIVLKNTEINEEEYESHIKDDWWLSTDEAYLYNVIDEIIDDITQEEE